MWFFSTDKSFKDSPQAGDSNCICSRCGKQITEDQVPIRVYTTNEKNEVDENSEEYRFCDACQQKEGFISVKIEVPFDVFLNSQPES